jgi:hypothetical protein
MSLYGADTLLVDSWSESQNGVYSLRRHLDAGTYTFSVEDFGRNDFDLAAPFRTCITTISDLEVMENDTLETADVYDLTSENPTIEGSIGHQTDVDWFRLTIPALAGSDLQLLDVTLNANQSGEDLQYTIMDANGVIKFSYIHTAGSGSLSQQILLGEGDHSMSVSLADGERSDEDAEYSVILEERAVNDSAELGIANNLIENALELTSATPVEGKIAYRGDIDWFELNVTPLASDYQVLEFSLTSSVESVVQYQMQVFLDEAIAAVDDPLVDDVLDISTAILVPPLKDSETSGVRRYFVKVSDVYANKSDADATYSLLGTVRSLNGYDDSQLHSNVDESRSVFTAEPEEQERQAAESNLIQLELNGYTTRSFSVQTDALKFIDPQDAGLSVRTVNADGSISIDLPWVSGFIDYSGDQDWYALDLTDLGYLVDNGSGPETEYSDKDGEWHYQLKIDLVSKAGENSEYQWRLYRDQGDNQIVRDRETTDGDGYFAQQGDKTLTTEAVSLTSDGLKEGDETIQFWVNDDWSARFYLAVSDFDFKRNPMSEATNPVSDADWSAPESPYSIRVSLIYFPGLHQPE